MIFSIRKHAFIRTWKRHLILQERLEARDLINIWLLEITHVIYHNFFLGNGQILWHINKIFQSTHVTNNLIFWVQLIETQTN